MDNKDKDKRNIIIACVLIVIFLLLVMGNFLRGKKKKTSAVPAVQEVTLFSGDASTLANMRKNNDIYTNQRKLWEGDWGRDPFASEKIAAAAAVVTEVEHLVLQGIFWDEQNPKAILNDKMLSKGDTLGTYKVVEIKPRSVVLSSGEKNIEVQVFNALSQEKPLSN